MRLSTKSCTLLLCLFLFGQVASAQHVTGIEGKVVYLNDLESHTWAYYSDPDCPIRSLNPADVTITYYGYGSSTVTSSSTSATPANSDFDADAASTAVKVNVTAGEDQNTFVYYKTLERTDGATAASVSSATGRCAYTLIANPFQVRPTSVAATRQVYLSGTSRGTCTYSYTDANGTVQTSSVGSGSTINTTVTAKVGTTFTVTSTGRTSTTRYSNITARYDNASGDVLATAVSTNGNYNRITTDTGTVAANDDDKWRGFYRWRVKSVSGGSIYAAATGGTALATSSTTSTNGVMLEAGQTYYLAPDASTGMTIELEALWAYAVVTEASNGSGANEIANNTLGVERNFVVLTQAASYRFGGTTNPRISETGRAATISRYYPDGTLGSASATVRGSNNITLSADTKFENVTFNNMTNQTLSAAGHNLTIGRGCSGTVRTLIGGGSNGMDYTLRIESGTYTNFYALNNHGNDGATYSGTNRIRTILGCDYDRANSNNDNLTINSNMWMGYACRFSNSNNGANGYFRCWMKSGKFLTGTISDGTGGTQSFYIGTSGNQNASMYIFPRYLYLQGGEVGGVAGGLDDQYYTNATDFRVQVRMTGGHIRGCLYGAGSYARGAGERRYILTGGQIGGWVAAGCNGIGDQTTETNNGAMDGDSYVYIGGNAAIGYEGKTVNDVQGGNVFGAGRGAADKSYNVGTVNNSNIAIADNAKVEHNVYGGGNYGFTLEKSNIYIIGGTVEGRVFGGANMTQGKTTYIKMVGGTVQDGLYGGCNTKGNMSGNVEIQIDGGQVGLGTGNMASQLANIHGGGYGESTSVSGNVSVTLGQCGDGSGAVVYGDVYGGSAMGTVNGGSGNSTSVTLNAGMVYGAIYGGGYGPGGEAADVKGRVSVAVTGGSVLTRSDDPEGEAGTGSVFGCNNVSGAPQSKVSVDIYKTAVPSEGYALHAVYGGGNKAAYVGTPKVTIHGCSSSIDYVYGGGNATDVEGTDVTVWGGTIGHVFGGGNGFSETGNHTNPSAAHYNPGANIKSGGTKVKIYGGTIAEVFGGSNQYGTINYDITVNVEPQAESGSDPCGNAYASCPMDITSLYGGGNEAPIKSSDSVYLANPSVTIDCESTVKNLFGGAKKADYGRDITLTLKGGKFEKVFGGNDQGGTITGNVTVTVEAGQVGNVFGGNNLAGTVEGTIVVNINKAAANPCTDTFWVGNVYGGGFQAGYSHSSGSYPQVNIINGTVDSCVYGGGYGAGATVTGSPIVTIGGTDGTKGTGTVVVKQNVYGGGNAAGVVGNPKVEMLDGNVGLAADPDPEHGCIFGAGRGVKGTPEAARVTGSTQVNLRGGIVNGNVYGGGHMGQVSGDTEVNVQ